MMMRFAKVTPEGKYMPPPPANSKASYATMLFVRADIVRNSGGVLSKAATIATRYAAVRRQTAPGPGGLLAVHTLCCLVDAFYSFRYYFQLIMHHYPCSIVCVCVISAAFFVYFFTNYLLNVLLNVFG